MIVKFRRAIRYLVAATQANGKLSQVSDKLAQDQRSRRQKPPSIQAGIWITSLLVTVVLIGLRQSGSLQFLELLAYDQMIRIFAEKTQDPRLLVVEITEQDIQQQEQWPLSDGVIAQALTILQAYQPKTIGLDIFRDVPHAPGTDQLRQALQAPNIIAVNQLPTGRTGQDVLNPPGVPPHRLGFADLPIDEDNVVRRYLIYVQSPSGKTKANSFALQIALNYLGDQASVKVEPNFLKVNDQVFRKLQPHSGGYQLTPKEASGWQTLLKYRGLDIARSVSLQQVLDGKIDPNWVKDKVVLIGVTAPSAKDTFPTPYSATQTKDFEMGGVVIHSTMVSQILGSVLEGDRQLWFWPQGLEWLWIWIWSLSGAILAWRINRLWYWGGMMALAGVAIWGLGALMLIQSGWIPVIPPLLGLFATGSLVLAQKAIYRTYYDTLTGLPNRRLFLSEIQLINQQRVPTQKELRAVLLIDFDRFKTINDGLGYVAGDYLLSQIAQRLQQQITSEMVLGRVGGDEFAICWKQINNPNEVTLLAERLQKGFREPFHWQGQDIYVTASIGIAFKPLDQEFRATELLRHADIAMDRAKELGTACHERFVAGMDTQAAERWQLETDLRAGLQAGEFQLYYQPIISLRTRKIAGFEALVRWISVKRGFVSPGDFIPLAEETGLIVPLGQWILQEACRQIHQWHERFPQVPPLIMSVNLSGRQFTQPDLVKQIQETLDQMKVQGDRLKLEITESMMMNDVEAAIELLRRLKDLGLRLSIDDFGTGYSSLSYLHRFPVDTLKVDRSFVSRMEEGSDSEKYIQIVRTIISLGHNLDLDVIAEGIETEAQVRVLESLNCEYGQGYFFSKPVAAHDAEALLVKDYEHS